MSSSCSPPLFFPSISPSSRRLCILSSRHLFFFFSFFPFFSSSPSLSLNSYILPLSVSLSLPLPSVYFFHHPVERNSEKERRWGGGGRRAQTGRGIKELRRGKRQSPFVTDEAFIEKRGSFSQFPVDILCSLFFPCCPSPSFCPNNPPPPALPSFLCVCAAVADCLESIKMVVGRWEVVGWDDGSLNTQFASHKSPPASRRHVTATSRDKQLKTRAKTGCREKHGGACMNTHMVCSDRQTGWTGFGQRGDKKKIKRKTRGEDWWLVSIMNRCCGRPKNKWSHESGEKLRDDAAGSKSMQIYQSKTGGTQTLLLLKI